MHLCSNGEFALQIANGRGKRRSHPQDRHAPRGRLEANRGFPIREPDQTGDRGDPSPDRTRPTGASRSVREICRRHSTGDAESAETSPEIVRAGVELTPRTVGGRGCGSRLVNEVDFSTPKMSGSITPTQLRAARALVKWSRDRLAAYADTTVAKIARFEGGHMPLSAATLGAIRATLESVGIEFVEENDGASGVRLRDRSP